MQDYEVIKRSLWQAQTAPSELRDWHRRYAGQCITQLSIKIIQSTLHVRPGGYIYIGIIISLSPREHMMALFVYSRKCQLLRLIQLDEMSSFATACQRWTKGYSCGFQVWKMPQAVFSSSSQSQVTSNHQVLHLLGHWTLRYRCHIKKLQIQSLVCFFVQLSTYGYVFASNLAISQL